MSYPDRVLDEIFFLIDKSDSSEPSEAARDAASKKLTTTHRVSGSLQCKSNEQLAMSLFPGYREWLEGDHIYDRSPEMYISVYFNQTNDLAHQYQMIRYMELRQPLVSTEGRSRPRLAGACNACPSKATNDLVKVWYKDLRKKRSRSFDDKPLLPGIPDYPAFSWST